MSEKLLNKNNFPIEEIKITFERFCEGPEFSSWFVHLSTSLYPNNWSVCIQGKPNVQEIASTLEGFLSKVTDLPKKVNTVEQPIPYGL